MDRYHGDKVFVDYLYVNHTRLDVCSKTRIFNFEPKKPEDVPWLHASVWDLNDVSHPTLDQVHLLKEKLIKPVALFDDPFRGGRHKMVLCDVMEDSSTPMAWSYRSQLVEVARRTKEHEILMGFEQEYYSYGDTISTDSFSKHPVIDYIGRVGMVKGTGTQRKIAEDHINACLTAGLNMYGYSREMGRFQWEYQLGPSDPVTLADHTVLARYILKRIAEEYNVDITFDPHPKGFQPSSLQLNFSTKAMRQEGGLSVIKDTLTTLAKLSQDKLLTHYDRRGGADNATRLLNGIHVPGTTFQIGWGEKTEAVRVPSNVIQDGCGYFEERRPSADCDPYELASVFIKAAILNVLE